MHNWKSTQVINSHLVCDPTIWQPGFDLSRQQWSLLNRFRTEQGHCGACRRKWRLTDTDLCPCDETQTMFHIVESCPLTKLNGGLSRLHSADEDAVSWLTSYGSWHAYEKKKTGLYMNPQIPAKSCFLYIRWLVDYSSWSFDVISCALNSPVSICFPHRLRWLCFCLTYNSVICLSNCCVMMVNIAVVFIFVIYFYNAC